MCLAHGNSNNHHSNPEQFQRSLEQTELSGLSPPQACFQTTVFVMVCCIEGSWSTWNVLVAVCWAALEHSLSYSALRTEEYQQTAIGTDTLHTMLRCPTLPGLQKFKKCLVLTNSRQGICFAESCGCSSAGLGKRQSRDFLGHTGCRVICKEEHTGSLPQMTGFMVP